MASKVFPAILIAVVVWLGTMLWRDSGDGLRKAAEGDDGNTKITLVPASARPSARDFTLTSAQGASVQLTAFRGKSPVVVNFFATWCPGCREELPHLIELYQKRHDAGLEVVMISDEPAELLKQYVTSTQIPFPVLVDDRRAAHRDYGVNSIPLTLLIDRDGKIATGLAGYSASKFTDEFVPAVDQLLKH